MPAPLLSSENRAVKTGPCRRNVRSSSLCKVESSALIGHGRARRGTVDVDQGTGPAEGAAPHVVQRGVALRILHWVQELYCGDAKEPHVHAIQRRSWSN